MSGISPTSRTAGRALRSGAAPSDRHDVVQLRLRAQRLTGAGLPTATDVVRHLGAVQSQDYPAAAWALGLRSRDTTLAMVDRALAAGGIVRTHVMRPTWHFVAAEDIRWLLSLTGPRVRRAVAGRHRNLGIDEPLIARAADVFARALHGGRHLTRPELTRALDEAGIACDGIRLAHVLLAAELDGLVISGPRRGAAFTWALFDERVPPSPWLDRDEALQHVAERYFRSHGPARLDDFVWWSGLTVADARAAVATAGPALARQSIAGVDHWYDAGLEATPTAQPVVHLVPNFDEYTVAYRDRSAIHPEASLDLSMFAFSSVLSNVVMIDGVVSGAWRRVRAGAGEAVEVRLVRPLGPNEVPALAGAVEEYGRFLERAVALRLVAA